MATAEPSIADPKPLVGRVATATILLFWAAQFSLMTAQRLMMTDDDTSYLVPRSLVTIAGIALSFAIARVHVLTRGRAIGRRLAGHRVFMAGGVCRAGPVRRLRRDGGVVPAR